MKKKYTKKKSHNHHGCGTSLIPNHFPRSKASPVLLTCALHDAKPFLSERNYNIIQNNHNLKPLKR